MSRSLILSAHDATGAYLARLLQARGQQVATLAAHASSSEPLKALGIADDLEQLDAAEALRRAASADTTTYVIAGPATASLTDELIASAPPRLIHIIGQDQLLADPAARENARRIMALRRDSGRFAANAILHGHDSRLAPASNLPARITTAAWQLTQGSGTGLAVPEGTGLDVPEGPAQDWGWTPEYVDAVARLATLPVATDIEVASGEPLTPRAIAEHALAYFRLDPAAHIRMVPGAEPPLVTPRLPDLARLKQLTGWSASTSGRDLVRALCEGAASRPAS